MLGAMQMKQMIWLLIAIPFITNCGSLVLTAYDPAHKVKFMSLKAYKKHKKTETSMGDLHG